MQSISKELNAQVTLIGQRSKIIKFANFLQYQLSTPNSETRRTQEHKNGAQDDEERSNGFHHQHHHISVIVVVVAMHIANLGSDRVVESEPVL